MRRTTWHFRSCRVLSLEPSIPATAAALFLTPRIRSAQSPFLYSNETRAATASVLQPSGHTAERGGQHVPGEGTDDEQHQDGNQSAWDLLDIVHTAAKIMYLLDIHDLGSPRHRQHQDGNQRHKSWISSTSSIPPPRSSSAVAKSQDSEVTCPAWDHERTVGHEQKVPTPEDQDGNQSVFMSTRTHRLIKKATNC
ncbi:unnamed protein product [Musa acuminata subsp. malaccensis]|uniref:(wild Malaysian banana) hypothetical protein n=1 Tax=Musa acuminata subsp. malaccensis TaxID=214687 RepID=A0A804IYU6_MUSAM|nr:PREDICTED: uncharacterized protein LOC103982161 isoform X1 [Musa acuminata subsp. malaccensis]CAG1844728.1 unnamed protein product [Musa acuminata subsp. malaccensis]